MTFVNLFGHPPVPQGEFTDAMLMALTRDTTWWCSPVARDWHDVRPHLLVLYSIAKWINRPDPRIDAPPGHIAPMPPPLCLEIGVRHAISTVAILCAMREVSGRLVSLEYDDGTRGDRENWAAKSMERVKAAGLDPWWTLHVVDSNDFDLALLPRPTLDLLFIDSAHDAAQVQQDIAKYSSLVRKNGMMILHDYFSHAEPCDPPVQGPWISEVSIPVDKLRTTGEWEICVIPFGFGLVLARHLK
jgi:predicted O-methyltransferase YrrM